MSNEWTSSLNGPFRGGSAPDLADLALFGAIGSFRGCAAFADMMEQNPKMKTWYELSREYIENSRGGFFLNNPKAISEERLAKQKSEQNQAQKKAKRFGLF